MSRDVISTNGMHTFLDEVNNSR